MTPRDVFGIVTRSIGLPCIVYGVWNMVFGIAESLHIVKPEYPVEYLIAGLGWCGVGAYLVFGADNIVALSYRNTPPDGES